jgi:hypothetical protein
MPVYFKKVVNRSPDQSAEEAFEGDLSQPNRMDSRYGRIDGQTAMSKLERKLFYVAYSHYGNTSTGTHLVT